MITDTQDHRLMKYLAVNKHIDPLQAWSKLGIYRLSACIHRLRKGGWEIETKRKNVKNRFGEKCYVGDYHLKNRASLWTKILFGED